MTVNNNNFFAVLDSSTDVEPDSISFPSTILDSPPKPSSRKNRKSPPKMKTHDILSISSSDLDLNIIDNFERPRSPEITNSLSNSSTRIHRKILEPVPKSTKKIVFLDDHFEPCNPITNSDKTDSLSHVKIKMDDPFPHEESFDLNFPDQFFSCENTSSSDLHFLPNNNYSHDLHFLTADKTYPQINYSLEDSLADPISPPPKLLIPYPRLPNSMPVIQKDKSGLDDRITSSPLSNSIQTIQKSRSFLDVGGISPDVIPSSEIRWNFPFTKTTDKMEIDSSFIGTPTPFVNSNSYKPKGSPVKKYNQFIPRIDHFNVFNVPKNPGKITFIKFSDNMEIFSQNRAGIVAYNITPDNKIEICMGVDSKTGDITDHGGRVKYDEHPVDAAIREFHEETLDVFHPLDRNDERIKNSFLLYSASTLIMFVKMDVNFHQKQTEFRKIFSTRKYSESSDLYITNLADLINDISNPVKSKITVYSLVNSLMLSAFQNYGDLSFYLVSN